VNEAIELHDSELAAVSFRDGCAIVSFRPAYIHHSQGVPGSDPGSGWLQNATLTFSDASPAPSPSQLPATVSDGSLRIGDALHTNVIPASGAFDGAIELSITLSTAETFAIRAQHLTIQLQGERRFIDNFPA
jgi:hypothetical protein